MEPPGSREEVLVRRKDGGPTTCPRRGCDFETSHIDSAGQAVIAQIPWGEWPLRGQIQRRVLRVDPTVATTGVALEWLDENAGGVPAPS